MGNLYAEVAVDGTQYSFDKLYAYKIPDVYREKIKPGMRVFVPFGSSKKPRTAMVFSISDVKPDINKVKSISRIIDDEVVLNDELLSLAIWLKERTFCTFFDAVKTFIPSGLNYKTVVSYVINDEFINSDKSQFSPVEREILNYFGEIQAFVKREKILKDLGLDQSSDVLEKLFQKNVLKSNYDSVRNIGDNTKKMVRLTDDFDETEFKQKRVSAKQMTVIDLLRDVGTACVKEVCYFTGVTSAVVNAVVEKGFAEYYDVEVLRTPFDLTEGVISDIKLSKIQNDAFEGLNRLSSENKPHAALLYGVTGSGKTQVYLKLIDEQIKKSKDVILMVPEISLTPQTIRIFKERYGKRIAVFHSALSMGERADEYKRVLKGDAKIAIGTRSAVFAPFKNLGLIIIDEEQEHTYKSESSPRYHAREVAKFRCNYNKCLLVMASATPNIESYANALSGRYNLFEMNERYGKAHLPEVITVDLSKESMCGEKTFLSDTLVDELKSNLENGHQSILLLNRRGYNTFVACKKCGNVVTCPNCSISMTYHSANNKLMCHYCGYSIPDIDKCEVCGADNIRYNGVGTQKIEEDLKKLLPEARVVRMDADSTMSRMSYENTFSDFSNGKYDILLGTQMVAKGLDFENVTLVGIVNADSQLNNDDFRSSERTFSLLTQVIGRSGRGKYKGKAIIQTYYPDNEIISFAKNQDYKSFFSYEIKLRKMLVYPPYCDICSVGFVGINEADVYKSSILFFDKLKEKMKNQKNEKIIVLGPVPLKVAKVGKKYRYRLIIKCRNSKNFREIISSLIDELSDNLKKLNVSVFADINPENTV